MQHVWLGMWKHHMWFEPQLHKRDSSGCGIDPLMDQSYVLFHTKCQAV